MIFCVFYQYNFPQLFWRNVVRRFRQNNLYGRLLEFLLWLIVMIFCYDDVGYGLVWFVRLGGCHGQNTNRVRPPLTNS